MPCGSGSRQGESRYGVSWLSLRGRSQPLSLSKVASVWRCGMPLRGQEPNDRNLRESRAHILATRALRPRTNSRQNKITGAARLSGKARSLHPRVHADAKEAELGTAESRAGAF